MRIHLLALVFAGMTSCIRQPARTTVMTVCDLSRDFAWCRALVSVRAFILMLRQQCLAFWRRSVRRAGLRIEPTDALREQ
jgi:hypothetical protein